MESTKNYFDTWLKSQEQVFGNLTEMTKRFQQALHGLGGNAGGMPGFGGFQDLYTSWTTSVLNALQGTGSPDINLLRETISKTLTGSNAYLKLYEIWQPLFKAIQERAASPDCYKDLTDPAKYKEMLDRIFGFDPTAVSTIVGQTTKLLETLAGSSQGFMKPWLDAAGKGYKDFPDMMEGHPESFMKIFHTLFSAFDSTAGRAFHVPAVGKDREKIELLLRSLDDLSVYLARKTEFEHMMYITGIRAFEKAIATVADKVSKGEEFKKFDEFFDLWFDVSEKAYYALFQTQDFSKKQGELLEASVNVRQHFFKLMELYLYDFPIALRSEMDDLYKTIYDLKKKVKSLEKQVVEARA
jgi:class III poly(R)-hydroxyalkanoic acid synthase PhaE subunit